MKKAPPRYADTLPIPQPPLTHTLDARPTDIVARQDAPPARQTRHESSAVPRCGLVRPTTLPWAPGRLQFCSILSLDFRPAPTLPTLVMQLHLNEILIPTATAVKRVKSARGLAPNCRVQVQLYCLENSSHEARRREAPWPLLSACAKSARVAPSTDSAPRRPTEIVWLWTKQKGGCAVRPMTVWRGGVTIYKTQKVRCEADWFRSKHLRFYDSELVPLSSPTDTSAGPRVSGQHKPQTARHSPPALFRLNGTHDSRPDTRASRLLYCL